MQSSFGAILMLVSNAVTAFSYFCLAYQLFIFVKSSQVMLFLRNLSSNSELKQRNMFSMIAAIAVLFASFIGLCGLTHTLGVLRYFFPDSSPIYTIQAVVLVGCAIVSTLTAIVSYKLLPVMFQVMENFELNSDGNVQHIEKYLVDIVEMMKESVIVLSEGFKVLRCNEASKNLFHRPSLVGCDIVELLHPEDVRALEVAVLQAREMYSQTPVTVEYRVRRGSAAGLAVPPQPPSALSPSTSSKKQPSGRATALGSPKNRFSASSGKIYAIGNLPIAEKSSLSLTYSSTVGSVQTPRKPDPSLSAPNLSDEYTWVESTICRGMRFNQTDQSECDFRMVSRCIDHRKRRAEDDYQDMLRASAEQARINAAKLRYISCIAHDLKTPLQSFCFSLDLLGQTMLIPEQRECIQQANVAVDLMKLTISQTMDISKALSGAKLVPRCATVTLSSVLSRVKVIIVGFGKQVPIVMDVATNVCDEIITDEEWLWQMLLNLLTNACKYTDKGSIHVKIRACTDITLPDSEKSAHSNADLVHKEKEALLFEVIDTGVGVSEGKLGSLFDAFSQLQDGQVTGTGLGLFGVRTRADGLGGTCGARHNTESSTGTGTVIWFAIPYIPDTRSSSLTRSKSSSFSSGIFELDIPAKLPPPQEDSMIGTDTPITPCLAAHAGSAFIRERKLTAMVIDDTLTVRKLMEKLLLRMGFARVDCYENGSKGLDAMMAGQVDIVFSDVQMPIMTGPEMVARFRKWEDVALQSGDRTWPQLVVAVTANGAQLGRAGEDNGFNEICAKPMGAHEILRVIHDHL